MRKDETHQVSYDNPGELGPHTGESRPPTMWVKTTHHVSQDHPPGETWSHRWVKTTHQVRHNHQYMMKYKTHQVSYDNPGETWPHTGESRPPTRWVKTTSTWGRMKLTRWAMTNQVSQDHPPGETWSPTWASNRSNQVMNHSLTVAAVSFSLVNIV